MNSGLKNVLISGIVIFSVFGFMEIAKGNANRNLFSKSDEEVSINNTVEDEIVEDTMDKVPEVEEVYQIEPLYDLSIDIGERLENYLVNEKSNIGFMYYNLLTGEKISFNENLTMEAASTYKVGLNLVCYDLVKKGQISLMDEVYYNEDQYQEGAGMLQFEEEITSLPLGTLLDYTILYSDNIAATMAYDYIGGWNSYRSKLFNLVGIENGNYKNVTNVETEFRILKYIYDNRDNEYYNYLLSNMKRTVFHDRLDKLIPYDIVAHKIGDMGYAAHDMGIVFTDEPYIIIMLTNDVEGANDIIADVSMAMYMYNSN